MMAKYKQPISGVSSKCSPDGMKWNPGMISWILWTGVRMSRAQDDIQEVLVSREDRESVATAHDDYMEVIG